MIEPITAIEFALAARNKIPALRALGLRLVNLAKMGGYPRLFAFGSPGSGKSTLAALLSGTSRELRSKSGYVPSSDTEHFKLSGEVIGSVSVVPGQPEFMDTHWRKLAEQLKKAKKPCVLYVAAYGYHTVTNEINSVTANISDTATYEMFAEHMRAREISQLKELIKWLNPEVQGLHFVVVMNKIDLWYTNAQEVLRWYTSPGSEFYDTATQLLAEKYGTTSYKLSFIPAAAISQNLTIRVGDRTVVLKPTSQGFDHDAFVSTQSKLFDHLNGILSTDTRVKVL